MNPELLYAYAADITKSERDAEGNLIVTGVATSPDLDLDGDKCDPTWLRSAMPKWFEWANIREMHQPVVAGVGLSMTEGEGDTWSVRSKCVDDSVAKKLESGAYKGYSIGIKGGRRRVIDGQNWIVDGEIVEISYVDRPCNPEAKLAIAKMVGSDMRPLDVEGELADAADVQKEAKPDGTVEKPDEVEPEQKSLTIGEAREKEGLPADPAADVPVVIPTEKAARPEFTERDRMKAMALVTKAARGAAAGEQSDIDGASEAIAVISRLIESECEGLANGDMGELDDIQLLIEATCALKYFMNSERREDMSDDMAYAYLAASADIEKRKFTADQRRQAAHTGAAMPGGRYPIEDADDLDNAITAYGRGGGDKTAIQNHIKKRAKALGLADKIPDSWKTAQRDDVVHNVTDADAIEEIVKGAVAEAVKAAEERTGALEAQLAKVLATPIPGGPVLLPVGGGAPTEASLHKRKADEYRAKARELPASMRGDYLALADELDKNSPS